MEDDVDALETQLATAREELRAAEGIVDDRDATIAALENDLEDAQAAQQPVSQAASTPQGLVGTGAGPAAPASVYCANCDAARAAGGAPVRAGGPGYGRHLDRDGDGVGCE